MPENKNVITPENTPRCGIADCEGDHWPQDHNTSVQSHLPSCPASTYPGHDCEFPDACQDLRDYREQQSREFKSGELEPRLTDGTLHAQLLALDVKQGQVWSHVTTCADYRVVAIGLNEADCTQVVVYTKAVGVGPAWVRPLAEFTERFWHTDD